MRKESGFEVTDRIGIKIKRHEFISEAVQNHAAYISAQTLALWLELVDELNSEQSKTVEIDTEVETLISVEKIVQQ
jgi:isoleucyl-tRNA synthetase